MFVNTLKFIHLNDLLDELNEDLNESLVEAFSESDFCFGTNKFSLITISQFKKIYDSYVKDLYDHEDEDLITWKNAIESIINKLESDVLINLENN